MAINAQDLVHLEVIQCVSSLVSTLAQGYGEVQPGYKDTHDLSVLADQAFELVSPAPDFEEAAREAGFRLDDEPHIGSGFIMEPDGTVTCFDKWYDLCFEYDIEPYEREVFEHWIITDWLAGKLIEKGEKVDKDFAGMTIWARTTTGQSIYMDGVIEEIAAELGKQA